MSSVVAAPQVAAVEETLARLLEDGLFIDGDWVESKDQDPNGDVRLIQLADVGDGVFRDRSSRFLTMAKAKELRCTFLQPGDVLVARMPEPLGRACIFPGVGQPAVTAVDVCILRPNPDRARVEWLVKAINSPEFRAAMQEFVRGTTRQRISRKNLGTLRISAPSVEEQLALADLVDRVELKRGAAANHVGQARKAIERFHRAVLIAACSGRLTSDWRDAHSPSLTADALISELLDDGGTRRPRSKNAQPPEPLAETPDSWLWTELRLIADLKGGVQKGAKLRADEPTREVPYLRVANVQRGWLDLSEIKTIVVPTSKIEGLRLEEGDILFNEGGDRDKLGRGWIWESQIPECVHQNHVFRARLRDSRLQPRFYSWFGNSLGARYFNDEGKQTVNLASLSMSKLGDLPVPVPPADEQLEIVRRVDQLLALTDSLQKRIEVASTRVERSSQAALAKAFRGELSTNGGPE